MHGAVCTLQFVPYWRSVLGREDKNIHRPNLNLNRTIGERKQLSLLRSQQIDSDVRINLFIFILFSSKAVFNTKELCNLRSIGWE